ncbi:siderophore-interacting protein [Salininema proteolyticum]|uniref:Siderophore-interacting protein n=1 Tax=Salininema proteolyticum TaxID=1607685 RepID=A0ABV8U108_9ACTN
MSHGWEGVVLKLFRGKDFQFTVTGAEDVTPTYRRVDFADGGLLAAAGVHPAMWVRLWFDLDSNPHQRAFTLVDPDAEAGTFSIEFALHGGSASKWAEAAAPGDTIDATLQGTRFHDPDPAPSRLCIVGDAASAPAVNSLLDHFDRTEAVIWFETQHEEDRDLPLRVEDGRHEVRWIDRGDTGEALVKQVRTDLPDLFSEDAYLWITCEAKSTRQIASFAKKELGIPKQRIHALGYWRA